MIAAPCAVNLLPLMIRPLPTLLASILLLADPSCRSEGPNDPAPVASLEPPIPVKFAFALMGVGAGFLFLVWGARFAGHGGSMPGFLAGLRVRLDAGVPVGTSVSGASGSGGTASGAVTAASGATLNTRSDGAGRRGNRRGFAHAYKVCL